MIFDISYFRNIWNFSNNIGREIAGTLIDGSIGNKIIVGDKTKVDHEGDSSNKEIDFHTHLRIEDNIYYPPSTNDILLLIQKNINLGLTNESFKSLVLAPEGVYIFSISENLLNNIPKQEINIWKKDFTDNLEKVINNHIHIDVYKDDLENYGVKIKFIKY
jgi:hypothetical protein